MATAPSIFIGIASYRDRWLWHTVQDALAKASAPERLHFGIIDQSEPEQFPEPRAAPWWKQLHYLRVPPLDARGPCWARYVSQGYYAGEDFYLQIDSHMLFQPHWDRQLIEDWRAVAQRHERVILTTYPQSFRVQEGRIVTDPPSKRPLVLRVKPGEALQPEHPVLLFRAEWAAGEVALPGFHVAGGCLFTLGRFIEEVPYDPHLYFHGEEQNLAIRAWTRGWDIYHPPGMPMFHLYKTADAPKGPQHWNAEIDQQRAQRWWVLDQAAKLRMRKLLYEQSLEGVYALGTQRSLEDFARFSGIDYPRRLILRRQAEASALARAASRPVPAAASAATAAEGA